MKFALRGLGGCALCLAAADFLRGPRSAVLVSLGLLVGSCLSAAAAQAEIWLPGAANFLGIFKTEPSMNAGYLRASGTFQYTNIASMYWEATLPLALAFSVWRGRRRFRTGWWWGGLICSIILMEAILLTASRAGILIAAMTLAAFFLMSGNSIAPTRSLAGASLLALCALCIVHVATEDLLVLRFTTLDSSSWYRADFEDFPERLTLQAGKMMRIPLSIHNRGRVTWQAQGKRAIAASYHWLDAAAEKILIWEGARSEIPANVEPGAAVKLEPWIVAPGKPGNYILQWDMLEEEVAWFSVLGQNKGVVEVTVLPSANGEVAPDFPPPIDLPLPSSPTRFGLWRAAVRMGMQNPFFGVGPDNFRRLYGSYLGLKRPDDRLYASSLYLEIFATVGLIGISAFLAFLIVVALKIRTAWRGVKCGEERLVITGIGAALAAYGLHGLMDYFLPFTPTYGLFWMLAGMAVGLGRRENSR